MFKPPAHKSGTAGQVAVTEKPSNQPSVQYPKYLYEEIARMEKAERLKLTFEEWWRGFSSYTFSTDDADSLEVYFKSCWTAAQENA